MIGYDNQKIFNTSIRIHLKMILAKLEMSLKVKSIFLSIW